MSLSERHFARGVASVSALSLVAPGRVRTLPFHSYPPGLALLPPPDLGAARESVATSPRVLGSDCRGAPHIDAQHM